MYGFLPLFGVLFVFQTSVQSLEQDLSKVDWCKVECHVANQTHNLCINPECKPAPGCQQRGQITKADKDFIIYQHNNVRNRFAKDRGVANMMALSWDSEAEYLAQCWANQCMPNGKPHDDCRINSAGIALGQNAHKFGANRSAMFLAYGAVVEGWYLNEVDLVPEGAWTSFFADVNFGKYGHATQLLWAKTTHVGCGWSIGSDEWNYVYCDYRPSGNYLGEPVYEAGSPASKCPAGVAPNSIYSGLCGEIQLANE